MIITWTCDLCGTNNDGSHKDCRHCGGITEERLIKGNWKTVLVKKPTIEMRGYYNYKVMEL
jgi:hypothetical protein